MSLDLKVGQLYSFSDLDGLKLSRFMPHYSYWSDGCDLYLFHHKSFRRLKIKYELERIIYQKYDLLNCCSIARLGA